MEFVTSREILDKLEIKSAKTLTRWHQRGLIPPPEIRKHESGRGRQAYWPHWVLSRCLQIKELVQSGQTLDEIADLLASDDKTHKPGRKYVFSEASKRLDEDAFAYHTRNLIDEQLRQYSQSSQELAPTEQVPSAVINSAIELAREGYRPVLIVAGETVRAVPDFAVSLELADGEEINQMILVLPLKHLIRRHLAIHEIADPTITPIKKVVDSSGQRSIQKHVERKEAWTFEVSEPNRAKKSK